MGMVQLRGCVSDEVLTGSYIYALTPGLALGFV